MVIDRASEAAIAREPCQDNLAVLDRTVLFPVAARAVAIGPESVITQAIRPGASVTDPALVIDQEW